MVPDMMAMAIELAANAAGSAATDRQCAAARRARLSAREVLAGQRFAVSQSPPITRRRAAPLFCFPRLQHNL